MKKYLSFGGGVNSAALMLFLKDKKVEFESIFANHETDLPETYQYIDYLKNKGFEITEVKPNYEGYSSLYEYCKFRKFLPSMYLRWCTYRFKLQPLWKYVEKPCVTYVGISYEEKHRAVKAYKQKQGKQIKIEYPLIENKISRDDCIQIIRDAGLEIPMKSGCWICPFQTKKQLLWLYNNHRDLFLKIVELEEIRGNKHYLKNKKITHYVPYKSELLTNYISTM